MIPNKHVASDADWRNVPVISKTEALANLDVIAERIAPFASDAVVCFSGGKDSMFIAAAAARVGVRAGVLARTMLEYPEMDRFNTAQLSAHFAEPHIDTAPLDHAWLRAHPQYLFPKGSSALGALTHRDGIRRFSKRNGHPMLVMGRRVSDGNILRGDTFTSKDGHRYLFPAATVSHETVLSTLHALNMPMAPCYSWPRGFTVGTGPWNKRRAAAPETCWQEIAQIDSSIIIAAAAEHILGAAQAAERFL